MNIYEEQYTCLLENCAPIHPNVKFGSNVRIGHGVVIQEGCTIGNNTIIGHYVVLRPRTHIADDCVVGHHTVFEGDITVNKRTLIHAQCHITKGVTIGEDVFIAPMFVGANTARIVHGRDYPLVLSPYHIADAVRIGINVTVGPGVHIGRNAQIGMGSVVTKSVPPCQCWVGNPAKFKNMVPEDELIR